MKRNEVIISKASKTEMVIFDAFHVKTSIFKTYIDKLKIVCLDYSNAESVVKISVCKCINGISPTFHRDYN